MNNKDFLQNNRPMIAGTFSLIANDFENFNIDAILSDINKDRQISKFMAINDSDFILNAIGEQRQFYKSTFNGILDAFKTTDLIESMFNIVKISTDQGKRITPILISDIVNFYEISSQEFFKNEESNIKYFLERIRSSILSLRSDKDIMLLIDTLYDICKNWMFVAEPLRIFEESKGSHHKKSVEISRQLRNLAIEISNKNCKYNLSLKLLKSQSQLFINYPDIYQELQNDINQVDMMAHPNRSNIINELRKNDKFVRDVTYEVEIGVIFRKKFKIDSSGISYGKQYFKLERIIAATWGGEVIIDSYRNERSNLIISIMQDDNQIMNIKMSDKLIFENITKRIFISVGIAILTEYLFYLKSGSSYKFKNMTIFDNGVSVNKKSIFSTKEQFYTWDQLNIKKSSGSLTVYSNNDYYNPLVVLPYKDTYNIIFIELAINNAKKKRVRNLSDALIL
ncbi:MAG: hypothetical protein LBE13_04785 [Bacteroidales bacterium]|nr:hypothetical protein [Bacteroidales bacterium]